MEDKKPERKSIQMPTADYEFVEDLKIYVTAVTGNTNPSMANVVMFLATEYKKGVSDDI